MFVASGCLDGSASLTTDRACLAANLFALAQPNREIMTLVSQDVLKMHRWTECHKKLHSQVQVFLDQFAQGSPEFLRYVGLLGKGKLAQALVC